MLVSPELSARMIQVAVASQAVAMLDLGEPAPSHAMPQLQSAGTSYNPPEREPGTRVALNDQWRGVAQWSGVAQVPSRRLRTEVREPMPGAWNSTILLGTHHKSGTVLLAKVFRIAAKVFDVPRHKNNYTACARLFERHARGVCIDEHVNANSMREWLRPQQPFIHAVRHPLEMCVSAYIYHKQGAEPWLLKPLQDFGGVSLMQHYKTVDPTEGVRFECRRMVTELVESAILYNRTQPPSTAPARPHDHLPRSGLIRHVRAVAAGTHLRRNVLSIRFEEFDSDFDDAFTRIFSFLDSGAAIPSLLKEAAQYDLKRAQPGDEKHVSASDDKAPLRAFILGDALLRGLLDSLSSLLGYTPGRLVAPNELCDQLRALCATTNVKFLQWCLSGRVALGQIASLPECGDDSRPRSVPPPAGFLRSAEW